MKKIILFLFVIMLSPLVFAQAEKAKPDWAAHPVHYEGQISKVVTISEYGTTKENTKSRAFKTLEDGGRRLNDGYRIIEEYWEYKGDWAYGYFLVQISNDLSCTKWENVDMNTTKYPFSARCFVPGMAQIYKGTKVKGGLIIGGEALGVVGIVTCYSMKASYEKLMLEDPKHKATYSQNADMWQNIGIGCIAFTAAVYIYNVIDGAIAPGKPHVQIGSKSYDVAFAPMATPHGDFGLAMQVKF
ncbi:MAG: hypothetical protein IJT12_00085 [Paludibacteraceae bacterium]|nr:hypothetical protein [Paludibacteraceae bacterium]